MPKRVQTDSARPYDHRRRPEISTSTSTGAVSIGASHSVQNPLAIGAATEPKSQCLVCPLVVAHTFNPLEWQVARYEAKTNTDCTRARVAQDQRRAVEGGGGGSQNEETLQTASPLSPSLYLVNPFIEEVMPLHSDGPMMVPCEKQIDLTPTTQLRPARRSAIELDA